jgi:hypothetical protein
VIERTKRTTDERRDQAHCGNEKGLHLADWLDPKNRLSPTTLPHPQLQLYLQMNARPTRAALYFKTDLSKHCTPVGQPSLASFRQRRFDRSPGDLGEFDYMKLTATQAFGTVGRSEVVRKI